MLVSNLALSPKIPLSHSAMHPVGARHTVGPRAVPALLLWLVGGSVVLLFVPGARADRFFGATLWFWLVAAPAINLLWLRRSRWLAGVRGRLSKVSAHRPRPRRQAVLRPLR